LSAWRSPRRHIMVDGCECVEFAPPEALKEFDRAEANDFMPAGARGTTS